MNTFRARAYLYMDQRQNTEYGLLRTYARLSFTGDNAVAYGTTNQALFEFAYIQLGGFTFGKFQNPYEHTYWNTGWIPYGLNGEGGMDNTSGNGVAYTASLGNGITATVAARASNETKAPTAGTLVLADGQAAPDGVVALEAVQSWGKAKLSGAVHQVRFAAGTTSIPSTEYGFGAGAGVQINLPMLAAGDFIGFGAQYAHGANLYGGVATFRGGQTTLATVDAVSNAAGTVTKLSTTWGVNAGFDHYWTKTVDTNIFAGYASYENSNLTAGATKAKHLTIGQYTKWTPIAGLQIGVETDYRKNSGGAIVAVTNGKLTEKSDFTGRLRVQRDF